jgi:hypothetical protein
MSLLRHSILRQSLLRHLLLRKSLLRLLILRQWPIVFAILALLAIQMQYGTAHLTWKGHGFYPESEVFFVCSAIVFKAFQRGPTKYFLQKKMLFHVDLIKMLSLISLCGLVVFYREINKQFSGCGYFICESNHQQ